MTSIVHLEKLTHLILIRQVLVTSLCRDHVALKECYDFFSARAMLTKNNIILERSRDFDVISPCQQGLWSPNWDIKIRKRLHLISG